MKNRILIIEDVQELSMIPNGEKTIMENCNVKIEFGKVGAGKTIPIVDSWPESIIQSDLLSSKENNKF
ncbi:TPA: hypothetical protein ACF8KN_004457 [Salmonella enterica]